jgi:dTDP-4-dehydrorhamnose 3,5-epimerase
MPLTVLETEIPDVVVVRNKAYKDARGSFQELYRHDELVELLHLPATLQGNLSISFANVLRGLHFQLPPSDIGKLVTCVRGNIFDVAVDIRPNSTTYGKWTGVALYNPTDTIWIPPGFAHGFYAIAYSAVLYQQTGYHDKTCDRTLAWNDPDLGITWPAHKDSTGRVYKPNLSDRDQTAPRLVELESILKTKVWKTY